MQTTLLDSVRATAAGQHADEILRRCVHCGFCNATCPTYQILGDELDGPRGRIYQIKQLLEGQPAGRTMQLHLDRCLTCRNCETTCPSGVQYSELLDYGRQYLEQHDHRPWWQRWQRRLVLWFILQPTLLRLSVQTAQQLRPLLPHRWRRAIPITHPVTATPSRQHSRKMLVLQGCVQSVLAPNINAAAAKVLDQIGIELISAERTGCCGAASHHTSAIAQGKALARRNIDAWWPYLESGVEAIVMTASGCGVHVKDYSRLLADDRDYRNKAERVSASTRDLTEVIGAHATALSSALKPPIDPTAVAVHTPCTLQHGQNISGVIESVLAQCGFTPLPCAESHLCCGSAGTYSILQRGLAVQLRQRKLDHLLQQQPQTIVTANIGCLLHLAAASDVPVKHWVELLAEQSINAR